MDWKQVIAELVSLGVNQPQMARICDCSQAAISLLATGVTKDPKHSTGESLLQLLRQKRAEKAAADKAPPPPAPPGGARAGQPAAATGAA